MNYHRMDGNTSLNGMILATALSDLTAPVFNLEPEKHINPRFIGLEEALSIYDKLSITTRNVVDKLVSMRHQSIM